MALALENRIEIPSAELVQSKIRIEQVPALIELNVGDVLENVTFLKRERGNDGKLNYVYWLKTSLIRDSKKMKGIAHGCDEIIDVPQKQDVKITNIRENEKGILVLSQVYHDLHPGDRLYIRVSDIGRGGRGDPMFHLNEYLGFIQGAKIPVGTIVPIEAEEIKYKQKGKILIAKLIN